VKGLKRSFSALTCRNPHTNLGVWRTDALLGDGNGLIEAHSKTVVEEQLRGLLSCGAEDEDWTA
jgi:hypothetical protein